MNKFWVFFWGSVVGGLQAAVFLWVRDSGIQPETAALALGCAASWTIWRVGLRVMRWVDIDFDPEFD